MSNAAKLLEACGASGPVRLTVAYPGTGATKHFAIPSAFVRIGRDPACDLRLDHEQVSDHHAYLQVVAGCVYCVDLGARSGTFWEKGGEGSGWLGRDEAIRVGPYRIQLLGVGSRTGNQSGHGSGPLQALPRAQDLLPGLVLVFQDGNTELLRWRMKPTLVFLGTSSRCKLQLAGPQVLSFHASLLRTPQSVWIIDLGGGIHVNGVPVRFARLEKSDQLEIGGFCMRVRFEPPRSLAASKGHGSDIKSLESGISRQESGLRSQLAARGQETKPDSRRLPKAVAQAVAVKQPCGESSETVSTNLPLLSPGLPGLRQISGQSQLSSSTPLLIQVLSAFGQMQQQVMMQHRQVMTLVCELLGPFLQDDRGRISGEIERLQQLTKQLQTLQSQLVSATAPPQCAPPLAAPSVETGRPERTILAADRNTMTASSGLPMFDGTEAAQQPHSWLVERMATLQNEHQTRWQKLVRQVCMTVLRARE